MSESHLVLIKSYFGFNPVCSHPMSFIENRFENNKIEINRIGTGDFHCSCPVVK